MSAIKTQLLPAEMWALQAKYGRTDYEGPSASRRYAFSKEKAEAIRNLSGWLAQGRALDRIPTRALDCMVAKLYANHKKTEISFRDLAVSFGGDHRVYFRAYRKMKDLLKPLELLAIERLRPYFEEQGIVQAQENY